MTIQETQQLGNYYLPDFKRLAFALTRDEDRARDLLQDALYLFYKNRTGFRSGTNFKAWGQTIIRNVFNSQYRQEKRRRELLNRDQPNYDWFGEHTIENPAESNLTTEEIMHLVEQLPEIYRRAFLLQLNGVKYKDISIMTNVPVGTAKSRVHTARMMLKEQLEKYDSGR